MRQTPFLKGALWRRGGQTNWLMQGAAKRLPWPAIRDASGLDEVESGEDEGKKDSGHETDMVC